MPTDVGFFPLREGATEGPLDPQRADRFFYAAWVSSKNFLTNFVRYLLMHVTRGSKREAKDLIWGFFSHTQIEVMGISIWILD